MRQRSDLSGHNGKSTPLFPGPGGLNGWVMFGASMAGDNTFFKEDGTSTFNSEGWVKGLTYVVDLYKNGYAPKDSVNWGFNEIVAGFYTGTCAMLDQDPDALIAISERMDAADYAVVPMPKGPAGKSFPTIGYAGWSMMSAKWRSRIWSPSSCNRREALRSGSGSCAIRSGGSSKSKSESEYIVFNSGKMVLSALQ